MFLTENEVLMG